MNPHKHAELIKAWADGAEIESRVTGNAWVSCDTPIWKDCFEYRIKPVICKYRVAMMRCDALMKYESYAIDAESQEFALTQSPYFVRWLTDWIEYESNT